MKPETPGHATEGKPVYSIIVPLLNEQESLPFLQVAMEEAMRGTRYEILYADDGSSDASWLVIQKMATQSAHVRGVRLVRHMGKAMALAAGIAHARGDYIITLDADLQNDPNDILALVAEVDKGHDLVCGWRKRRYDVRQRVWLSHIFNSVVVAITGVKLHDSNCGMKVARAEVFRTIKLYGQLHRYVPMFAVAHGFCVSEHTIRHVARRFGRSRYGLSRYFYAARDLLVALAIVRWGNITARPHTAFRVASVVAALAVTAGAFLYSSCFGFGVCGASFALALWLTLKQRGYARHRFNASVITDTI